MYLYIYVCVYVYTYAYTSLSGRIAHRLRSDTPRDEAKDKSAFDAAVDEHAALTPACNGRVSPPE